MLVIILENFLLSFPNLLQEQEIQELKSMIYLNILKLILLAL